ncbi:MAG: acetyl-CoA carboxylase biotin carboxyl carrier protein [Saprospiraceae bacterium]|nr:acetyl-CoA carboxylase biotin carboxyl carrier protein [Saprospiraceae bacterium]
MDYREIQNLIKLAGSSNISELKLKNGDFKLTIRTKDYHKFSYSAAPQPTSFNVSGPVQSASSFEAYNGQTNDIPSDENLIQKIQPEPKTGFIEIKSPIVGTFYRSAGPDKEAYVKIGDHVNVKSVVCIVEAMKLFNEIESDVSGKIVDVLVEDGSPVEYDQVLFLIDPKG